MLEPTMPDPSKPDPSKPDPMKPDLRRAFLDYSQFAVAGASRDKSKYGNIVYHALRKAGKSVVAINPNTASIDGELAYAKISLAPHHIEAVSIVTPPNISRQVVLDAIQAGVKAIWFQPGAENLDAAQLARESGIEVIDDGSCILVALARR